MANYKATVFFGMTGTPNNVPAGWSETYYLQAGSINTAFTQISGVLNLRLAMLAKFAFSSAVRISDIDTPRVSQIFPYQQDGGFVDPTAGSDLAFVAALITIYSAATYQRKLYLRGVPDAVFDIVDPTNNTEVQFRQAFNDFSNLITAGSPSIYLNVTDRTTNPHLPVISIAFAPLAKTMTVTMPSNPGFVAGDMVAFYNFKKFKPTIGRKKVISATTVSPWEFVVEYENTFNPGLPPSANVMKVTKKLVKADGASWDRMVHRITGRPFGLQRGRRLART